MIRLTGSDRVDGPTGNESGYPLEEVTDPTETALLQAQQERFRRNSEWLQAHWGELVPSARGRFLAIAGQEAFVAASPEEAWVRAAAAHPEDDGAFCQYVPPQPGPRIYAHRR